MKRHTQNLWRLVWLPALLCVLFQSPLGMWMQPAEVPLERLLRNTEAYIKKNPNEAQGYYVLGRLHSLAFARETKTIAAYEDGKRPLPSLPPYESILVQRDATKKLTPEAMQHLGEALRNYQRATELAPNEAAAFLGLGWMLETGVKLAEQPNTFKQWRDLPQSADQWLERALAAYRKAYALTVKQDLANESAGPTADSQISLEAGAGIQRLLRPRGGKLSEREQQELADIRSTIAKLQERPRAVTPIIFSLTQASTLESLLATGSCARFDLSGDGVPRWWPWLKPETGLLVWDQANNGRVQSGLQLFGSSTWWIAWQNGYQPLALLDDNHDGWLAGTELRGLAVWRDRNGNGSADKGEVQPVRALGIRRIAVQATTKSSGVPANPQGLQMNDGRLLPTYDWTPTEIKAPALALAHTGNHSRAYEQK
ncbi:MAG: hypothetical protein HY269_10785 [Deltaproteobacteria bacterium]|nr:hypothetical protein [Deltaproteobacteria bacterium]